MDGNQFDLIFLLALALLIWNLILTYYLVQTKSRFKKLTTGATGKNLEQIIEKLIERQDVGIKNTAQVSQDLITLQKRSIGFFQKSALLRFNPFEDAGGDQSFVAALLDGNDNGFIISSLHSRSGTRVYAKEVKNGKSTTHSLTKEEKEALEKALKKIK